MITDIAEKVYAGERLTYEDGLRLFHHHNVTELGLLADSVRWTKHPEPVVTYNVGRNINYTNVCWVRCTFCAFYRPPGHAEGYTLSDEEIFRKIDDLVTAGGAEPESCEILMQGGLNPKLRIEYYERLFSTVKARYPAVYIHSLSVAEIVYIAHISRLSVEETLVRLRNAGLSSLPGAGAEILDDEVRRVIAYRKETTDEWLDVHRTAHCIGMKSTATMMFGSVETVEHRLRHLLRVRDVQDDARARDGGYFTAFIAWSFQPEGTELEGTRKATGYDYLRTVAVARLMLDNIENIQASYVTQGPKIAQIALRYGINDFGSTMMEENVISAGGTSFVMPVQEIERLIRDAGFEPRRRNTRYEAVK
ncbi:MAG: dehypoxanthine futalosine cyclase [Candidatus Latescibacteria bacterium]|nr:dehypoxanthine futalosine cyclase [Candidatus Latescibacterota bacterium]